MSETFQTQLIEARRKLILDAAIEVVSERGFQHTTIKDIASRAKIADGTIYNYFESKNDIFTGIVARLSEDEAVDIELTEAEELDFSAFVNMFVDPRMEEINERYSILKAIFPEMISNSEIGSHLFDQIYAPMYGVIEQYFQQLIDDEQIDEIDPALAGRLFASPFLGLALLRMSGDEHIAANWDSYTVALRQFLYKAFQKND